MSVCPHEAWQDVPLNGRKCVDCGMWLEDYPETRPQPTAITWRTAVEIEVTQADRNEAEKHWLWLLDDERDELVQGFARHRQAAFAEGFSAALQGAEAAIWRIEDDAFLYENVSKALQEVISELQAMEQNWTGRVTIEHRQAAIKERDARADAARREALEEAAKVADGYAAAGKDNPQLAPISAQMRYCAQRIRALKGSQQ